MNIVPVILAGGIGERFWPLSRKSLPKQLLPILGRKTMLEETIARVKPFCGGRVKPCIVTGRAIASRIRKKVPGSKSFDFIVEPEGKNTAPAIAAAAVRIMKKHGDAVMCVLPADHAVRPVKAFQDSLREAVNLAERSDCLCVFGIKPSRPETGYGYIHAGEPIDAGGKVRAYSVRRFVEKPSQALARSYCVSGNFFWNSGMFVWKASVILQQIESHMPDLYRHVARLLPLPQTSSNIDSFYHACPRESIDYGVMEKSSQVTMICPSFEWDDVGSWESLERVYGRDRQGNTVSGKRIFHADTSGSIVVNTSGKSIAVCGVTDAVAVATDDAVLVISRDKLPRIRKYLAAMKSGRSLPHSIF
jgi:mannose-1-phosphate guanylyltransferase